MSSVPADPHGAPRRDFTLTVDGRAVAGEAWLAVVNPATGAAFAECPDAGTGELDAAVAAARRASADWRRMPWSERAARLAALAGRIEAARDSLAPLLTAEQGKPLRDAENEVTRAAYYLRRLGDIDVPVEVLEDGADRRVELRHRPLGVVGAITPWNFPLVLGAAKMASALVTGNTLVLKPSPWTPLTTLAVGELGRELFPPGVFNVLSGGDRLGAAMTLHEGIDKISFTGSVATGRKIMAAGADGLKRLTLELGGNDPGIVLPDVEPEAVADRLFWAAFMNSGQVCVALKRLYVHEDVHDALCGALAARAAACRVGDGMDPATDLGPVQNRPQYERVLGILEDTLARRHRLLAGGEVPGGPGYFVPPTLVADVAEGCRLVDEEPFGPLLPVIRYRDLDEVVRRSNATRFGLGGSVWTADPERGAEIAARLEVGTAWVNQHAALDPAIPFGGVKDSGIGREYSRYGLEEYMAPQVVHVARSSGMAARRAPGLPD